MLSLEWQRPFDRWNYVTGYKVHVWTGGNREQVGNCLFSKPQDTKCVLLLDDLRTSPFNIQTGQSISMKIFAVSPQGDSQPSNTFNANMPQDTCRENNISRLDAPSVDFS